MAIESGIQFGPRWKPLEHGKSSPQTAMMLRRLEEPINADYQETPLHEVIDELKMRYRFNIQLSPEVDSKKAVTYKCHNVTAALDTTLGS